MQYIAPELNENLFRYLWGQIWTILMNSASGFWGQKSPEWCSFLHQNLSVYFDYTNDHEPAMHCLCHLLLHRLCHWPIVEKKKKWNTKNNWYGYFVLTVMHMALFMRFIPNGWDKSNAKLLSCPNLPMLLSLTIKWTLNSPFQMVCY